MREVKENVEMFYWFNAIN